MARCRGTKRKTRPKGLVFLLLFGRAPAPAIRAAKAKRERFIYSGDIALAIIADLNVIILLIHGQMKNLLPITADIALNPRVFGERNVRV